VTAAWVAGSVRADAMARRRYGAAAARSLAATPGLDEALQKLVTTPFGHDVRLSQSLDEAERAVAATVLWHWRVLAGWSPWEGIRILRVLAAGYEIANVDELVRGLHGGPVPPPYQLGALSTWWPHLEGAGSIAQLGALLAASPWGDPGQDSVSAIQIGMRLAWAHRAAGQVPEAWRLGGAALLVARERFGAGRRLLGPPADLAEALLGGPAIAAASWGELVRALPRDAAWVFEGVQEVGGLWRAEAAWWRRVEHDGFRLLRGARFEPPRLLGAAAVLAADAWRVRAALEVAARGGTALEAFDAVA
jgi:hypothetical protein